MFDQERREAERLADASFEIVSPKYGTFRVLVDAERLTEFTQHKWSVAKNWGDRFYVVRFVRRDGKRTILRLHREVLRMTDNKLHVDHINGDTLDNRAANLRPCTTAQNTVNTTKIKLNASSRYLGVSRSKGVWQAAIKSGDQKIYLGRYATEMLAGMAYLREAIKRQGEFLNLDHPQIRQLLIDYYDAENAGCESVRAERAELGLGWRAYDAERARSAKLKVELQYIVDREWTASPDYDIAWKWINDFVKGARKALDEYEASQC